MSKKFISILLGLFILTAVAFFLTLRWGSQLSPLNQIINAPPGATAGPQTPKTPSVTLTIQKGKKGNTFIIRWENLPDGTTALKIYRGKTGTDQASWSLWKTVSIPAGELSGGSATIDLGFSALAGYSFYTQAVTSGNNLGNSTNTVQTTILWTSSSTGLTVVTSTPQAPSSTSTSPSAPLPSTPSTTPASPPSGGQTPTGTPYYTPQIQISGYGQAQAGNFWVQHIDQKIQIGWQNLPSQTTSVIISRSPNQSGPWTAVLTQGNPGSASYSIQIADDTLGNPYYYKMDALSGSTTVATYGPVYLPPLGQ